MKKIASFSLSLLLILGLIYVYMPSDKSAPSSDSNGTISLNASTLAVQLNDIFEISNSLKRRQQLDRLFKYWMGFGPFDAVKSIQKLPNANHRSESYKSALLIWSKLNNDEFMGWLTAVQLNTDLDIALLSLIESVGENHAKAMLYADKISDSSKQQLAYKALLTKWIVVSPELATDWVLNSLNGSNQWLILLFETLAQDNPELAVSTLSAFANTSDVQISLAIQTVVTNLDLEHLPPELIIAIQTMTPYAMREEFIAALVPVLFKSKKSSLEEIDALISSLLPGHFQDELNFALALNWTFVDPIVSSKYAESLTGEARDYALDAVVKIWLSDDLVAADEWLKTVKGNVDLAAGSLSRGSVGQGNLSIADKWTKKMEDENARTEVIYDVFKNWYDRNPLAGTSYVIENPLLSKEQKLAWLTEAGPNRFYETPEEAFAEYAQAEADDLEDAALGIAEQD